MATPYTAGRYYEYKCVKDLRARGYHAVRTAGSHGPFDVIAWNQYNFHLIQVKKVGPNQSIQGALRIANKEWSAYHHPPHCCIQIQTWVYSYGHVDKFTH